MFKDTPHLWSTPWFYWAYRSSFFDQPFAPAERTFPILFIPKRPVITEVLDDRTWLTMARDRRLPEKQNNFIYCISPYAIEINYPGFAFSYQGMEDCMLWSDNRDPILDGPTCLTPDIQDDAVLGEPSSIDIPFSKDADQDEFTLDGLPSVDDSDQTRDGSPHRSKQCNVVEDIAAKANDRITKISEMLDNVNEKNTAKTKLLAKLLDILGDTAVSIPYEAEDMMTKILEIQDDFDVNRWLNHPDFQRSKFDARILVDHLDFQRSRRYGRTGGRRLRIRSDSEHLA